MKSTLTITNLHASLAVEKEILSGVNLKIASGEVHAIMGPNGSGKSTLASVLLGSNNYEIQKGEKGKKSSGHIILDQTILDDLDPEDRAKAGLYLAFQSPIAIPGVSVVNLLRTAYQEIHREKEQKQNETQNPVLARRWRGAGVSLSDFSKQVKEYAHTLAIPESFLTRGIHDGFSGGEKKKIEMLQALVLRPKFAIFDEIDTGLDVDALKLVAGGITLLKKQGIGVLIITHYQRILDYVHPDVVHIFMKGKIVKTGGPDLAKHIEKKGYDKFTN